jgi:hypothetical protein
VPANFERAFPCTAIFRVKISGTPGNISPES